jgi:hypothetical protein
MRNNAAQVEFITALICRPEVPQICSGQASLQRKMVKEAEDEVANFASTTVRCASLGERVAANPSITDVGHLRR